MNNNNPPPSTGQQNAPAAQPGAGAAGVPAAPGVVVPGAMGPPMAVAPGTFTPQPNTFMQYQYLASMGKLTQEVLNANPQMMHIHAAMVKQQQLAAQALAGKANAAAAAAAAAAGGGKGAGGSKQAATGLPSSTATASRKRKSEHHTLPDHPWDFFPESPLFVSLQDAERRIDAALNRKMAVLTDLAASQKLVVEGRAVGDTPGSARKRLRIYIFSRHYNQSDPLLPSNTQNPGTTPPLSGVSGSGLGKNNKNGEPPSWALHINGRVLDPDACHPGGGGDPEPPEDARITRHRLTYYLKRLEVQLKGEDGALLPDGVVVWQKHKMDHEARNAFEIKRQGSRPVKATITLEMDYSPEFYTVPAALEALIGLQTGEGGVSGLYSMTHIASKVWNYCRTQKLVHNTLDGPMITPNEALINALNGIHTSGGGGGSDGGGGAAAPQQQALNAEQMQELIKNALGKPKPLILEHDIAVTGHDFSPITCVDLHLEVPLEFARTNECAPVVAASDALDKHLEQLDTSLAACWYRFREHKRRRTFLAAFSEDPVGCIREIVLAQGKELRIAAGKEYEAIEVMRAADLYGDKWTQDAIMKYITKKQAGIAVGPPNPPQIMAPAQAQAVLTAQMVQVHRQAFQHALAMQNQQVAVPLNQVPAEGAAAGGVPAPAPAAVAPAAQQQ